MKLIVKCGFTLMVLSSLLGCGGGSSKTDSAESSSTMSSSSVATVSSNLPISTRSSATGNLASSSTLVSSSSLARASSSSSTPSSSSSSVNPLGVARVAIDQTAVLLTQNAATKQLSAKVTDFQGNALSVPISWFSTRPNDFAVDSTGTITALVSNGASQIVAEVNGVKSAPVLVVVTKVPDNAVLLNDIQIVGEPTETTPGADPAFTNTYDVNLTGVAAPEVGTVLINTESKMVAGRVIAASANGALTKVTLGLVSLREMFPKLNLKDVIDLTNAEITPTPKVAALYDVVRTGNAFSYTPKAVPFATSPKRLQKAAAKELGPFTCERFAFGQDDTDALFEYELEKLPTFSVTINPSLDVIYTEQNGLERLVLQAVPTVDLDIGLKTALAVEAKVECKAELYVIRLPIGGALSFVMGGNIPIGVGFDFGGKLSVVDATVGASLKASSETAMGLACPAGKSCSLVHSIENTKTQLTPRISLPSLQQVQFEPGLSGFAYAEMEIGSPILRTIRFTALEVKAGAKLEANFASVADQIASADPEASAKYGVNLAFEVDLGKDLSRALELLGVPNFTDQGFEASTPIAQSPAGIATHPVTADVAHFAAGDEVNFIVKLDTSTANFFSTIGPYNVKKVQLIRNVGGVVSVVAEQSPGGDGHKFVFGFTYLATDSGNTSEFSAFVVTELVPFDALALEIGTAFAPPEPAPGTGTIHVVYKYSHAMSDQSQFTNWDYVYSDSNSVAENLTAEITYSLVSESADGSLWKIVSASGNYNYGLTNIFRQKNIFQQDVPAGSTNGFGLSGWGTEVKGCTVLRSTIRVGSVAGTFLLDLGTFNTLTLESLTNTYNIVLPKWIIDKQASALTIAGAVGGGQTASGCKLIVGYQATTSWSPGLFDNSNIPVFNGLLEDNKKGIIRGNREVSSSGTSYIADWELHLPKP